MCLWQGHIRKVKESMTVDIHFLGAFMSGYVTKLGLRPKPEITY